MEAADVLKVFHFARFDIATLRYHLGIQVAPIFVPKLPVSWLEPIPTAHGLKDLVQELEQVELDKSAQSSDWGNANLSDAQPAMPPMMFATC